MLGRILLVPIIVCIVGLNVPKAQSDSAKIGSMYFKSYKIYGNDTIIEEKSFDLNNSNNGIGFNFRFGGDSDTSGSDFQMFDFNLDTDGLFDLHDFFDDNTIQNFRFFNYDSLFNLFNFQWPGTDGNNSQEYRFKFSIPDVDGFNSDNFSGVPFFRQSNFPTFSVEDVDLYPESNSVKNFVIKPVTSAGIFIVEADLNNKKSVFTVYDSRGKTIINEKFRSGGEKFQRVIPLKELNTGTYFVEIKNGRSLKKKRLVIQ